MNNNYNGHVCRISLSYREIGLKNSQDSIMYLAKCMILFIHFAAVFYSPLCLSRSRNFGVSLLFSQHRMIRNYPPIDAWLHAACIVAHKHVHLMHSDPMNMQLSDCIESMRWFWSGAAFRLPTGSEISKLRLRFKKRN